jgi:hypothetical protein
MMMSCHAWMVQAKILIIASVINNSGTDVLSRDAASFFLSFLLFILLALLIVIFLLKPEKPIFSFQTIRLDWYKMDVYSGSVLFVSSVITLTLNAQNPNKVGLRYSPSRLNVYYEGVPIGVIRVPGFFQPAHSNNVSVRAKVLFHCVNVSQLVAGASLQDGSRKKDIIQMNILGDVRAQLWVFHMTLFKIKVCSSNSGYHIY